MVARLCIFTQNTSRCIKSIRHMVFPNNISWTMMTTKLSDFAVRQLYSISKSRRLLNDICLHKITDYTLRHLNRNEYFPCDQHTVTMSQTSMELLLYWFVGSLHMITPWSSLGLFLWSPPTVFHVSVRISAYSFCPFKSRKPSWWTYAPVKWGVAGSRNGLLPVPCEANIWAPNWTFCWMYSK